MRFMLLVMLAVSFLQPALADEAPEQQRVLIRFLEALDQPSLTRREFIRQNMTPEIIESRTLEGLDEAMASLSGYLGAFEVHSVEVADNSVTATIHLLDKAEWLLVELPLVDTPNYRIDGINAVGVEPPVGFVPEADPENITEVLSDYMNAVGATGFSGAVLVTQQDRILYAGAFGPEHNTLMTAFNIGPASAMLTSVMIMKLVEAGELDLNAMVGRYLPDWPNERVRNEISILHLLSHQSGIPAISPEIMTERRARLHTVPDYVEIFAEQPLRFTPGSRFEYSDSGIILLGLVAERVAGRSFDDLMAGYIYEPAGMDNSGRFSVDELEECCAVGIIGDDQTNTGMLPWRGSPAAGSYATVIDLARFALAFMGGHFVSQENVEMMISPSSPVSASEVFSLAGFVAEEDGQVHVGYRSGGPGIGVDFAVYPVQAYTVIVLSNQNNGAVPVARMLRRIIGQLME